LKKRNKNMLIAIIACIAILAIGGIRIIQIERNYQANQLILEDCINNYGIVTIEQKYFWSLTSAACEEN
jgi:hypothetical protein